MAEQAVLVLGPSPRFLTYIAQVLPALGETAVVSATCDTLVPGVVVAGDEDRRLAEIKGRAAWQTGLADHVRSLLPRPRGLTLRWEGDSYRIDAGTMTQMLAAATQGRSYHRARDVFAEQLHHVLAGAVAERRARLLEEMEEGFEDILARVDRGGPAGGTPDGRTGSDVDGLMSVNELEDLRDRIAGDDTVARYLEALWPSRDAGSVLRALLDDPALMERFLSAGEAALVAAEPAPWAPSDIPLLDAVADLLGDVDNPRPQGEFLADRARQERGWVYGHVVIDEAQELSEMQWHMVLRRCPTRSVTAVGDIDQAGAAHQHTSWAQAVAATLGSRWTAAELTICYRTPREVMALTAPVLQHAGSRNAPPRAVRSSGIDPWELTVTAGDLPAAAAKEVARLCQEWRGGTVGVVAADAWIPALVPVLGDVPVLTATQAKGLEWDATLVVDPHGIAAGPRGWNGLYVALTRCTQELGQLVIV